MFSLNVIFGWGTLQRIGLVFNNHQLSKKCEYLYEAVNGEDGASQALELLDLFDEHGQGKGEEEEKVKEVFDGKLVGRK